MLDSVVEPKSSASSTVMEFSRSTGDASGSRHRDIPRSSGSCVARNLGPKVIELQ